MPVNNRYGGGGGHTAARRSECSARSTTCGFEFHPRTATPVASADMLRAAETELEAVARFGRDHGLAEVERSVPRRTVVLSWSCPALFRASAKRSRWTSVSTKPSRKPTVARRNKIVNLHTVYTLCTNRQHMPRFCLSRTSYPERPIQNVLSRTSFGIPRPGCLRLRVRKVAAMWHRRDVLDVLSLIDQSTVDLSVFDASVNVAADPNGAA